MSVKIRLRRMGKKKQPHYRIVVADSRSPRDGRFVENLGYYNPIPDPARLVLDLDRVDYWVGQGAILTRTVGNLVSKARAGGDDSVALGDLGTDAVAAGNGKADGADAPPAAEAAPESTAEADAAPEVEAGTDADPAAEAEASAEAEADAEAEAEAAEADAPADAEDEPEAEADVPAEAEAGSEPAEGETA